MSLRPSNQAPGGSYPLAGQSVARIGFGAMQLDRLRSNPLDAVALLRRGFELGVNHVDTAEFYGNGFANAAIREAMHGMDGIVVVSKVGADPDPHGPIPLRLAQRPEQLRQSVEANLRSLGLEQIPVVNLRRTDVGPGVRAEGDQVIPIEDQLDAMIAMRKEGKIGAFGVSAVNLDSLRKAQPAGVACVQNAYSLVSREFEAMLEYCVAQAIAWVPFFPLGGAFARMPKVVDQAEVVSIAKALSVTPAQVGLAWLLARSPNMMLIAGTASVAHLEENMAVDSVVLDDAMMHRLDAMEVPHTEHDLR
ncbi:aldo/keto reductase [Dyella sp.]|uniref:aldo/keto reductase n=1 Tax=Dyella sp. TaxID=1869338 RepID=UPI002ED6296B